MGILAVAIRAMSQRQSPVPPRGLLADAMQCPANGPAHKLFVSLLKISTDDGTCESVLSFFGSKAETDVEINANCAPIWLFGRATAESGPTAILAYWFVQTSSNK